MLPTGTDSEGTGVLRREEVLKEQRRERKRQRRLARKRKRKLEKRLAAVQRSEVEQAAPHPLPALLSKREKNKEEEEAEELDEHGHRMRKPGRRRYRKRRPSRLTGEQPPSTRVTQPRVEQRSVKRVASHRAAEPEAAAALYTYRTGRNYDKPWLSSSKPVASSSPPQRPTTAG